MNALFQTLLLVASTRELLLLARPCRCSRPLQHDSLISSGAIVIARNAHGSEVRVRGGALSAVRRASTSESHTNHRVLGVARSVSRSNWLAISSNRDFVL